MCDKCYKCINYMSWVNLGRYACLCNKDMDQENCDSYEESQIFAKDTTSTIDLSCTSCTEAIESDKTETFEGDTSTYEEKTTRNNRVIKLYPVYVCDYVDNPCNLCCLFDVCTKDGYSMCDQYREDNTNVDEYKDIVFNCDEDLSFVIEKDFIGQECDS